MKTTRTIDLDDLTVVATLEPDRYGRPTVVELHLSGRVIAAEDLRAIPIGQIEAEAAASTDRSPLHPRQPGESAEAFSARVADAFKAVAATTRWPATTLAREAGVAVGTVHRWIGEARLRGMLPPASRRKGQ
jgi:hypothetical protein